MAMWLYQMSKEKELAEDGYKYNWTPAKYRKSVRKGRCLQWKTRKIRAAKSGAKPKAGDTVVYWFVKRGTANAGLYGVGIIFEYDQNREAINHLPIFPSDYIKKHPVYDDEIKSIIKKIQNNMPRSTMFEIKNNQTKKLWAKIRNLIIQYGDRKQR